MPTLHRFPAALLHNLKIAQCSTAKTLAVVKGDAYGYGLSHAYPVLRGNVQGFMVSNVEEAVQLTDIAASLYPTDTNKIVVLGPVFSTPDIIQCAGRGFVVCLSSLDQARLLTTFIKQYHLNKVEVWIELDIGLNRSGVSIKDLEYLYNNATDALYLSTIYAHYPNSECFSAIRASDSVFKDLTTKFCVEKSLNGSNGILYSTNSYDWIRPGIMLYGNIHPFTEKGITYYGQDAGLQQSMQLIAQVIHTRQVTAMQTAGYGDSCVTFTSDKKLALLDVGYSHGYPRIGKAPIWFVRQQCCAYTIDKSCVFMNQMLVDITNVPDVHCGDTVIVLGHNVNPLDKIADMSKLSANDISCAIGRLPSG